MYGFTLVGILLKRDLCTRLFLLCQLQRCENYKEESHAIDLLSIQIDKYKNTVCPNLGLKKLKYVVFCFSFNEKLCPPVCSTANCYTVPASLQTKALELRSPGPPPPSFLRPPNELLAIILSEKKESSYCRISNCGPPTPRADIK